MPNATPKLPRLCYPIMALFESLQKGFQRELTEQQVVIFWIERKNMETNSIPNGPVSYEVQGLTDPQAVFDALERRDDVSIWNAARLAPSQDMFYEQLRAQVGYSTYHYGQTRNTKAGLRHHCAMVMMPLIFRPRFTKTLSSLFETTSATRAITTISAWIGQWLNYKSDISLVSTPIGYSEICRWSPSEMRGKLDKLVEQKTFFISTASDQAAQENSFRLPEDAPRLMFIVGYIQCPLEWPTLPAEDSLKDMRLISKVVAAMQFCTGRNIQGEITARPPSFASEALTDGIICWLDAIHAHSGIYRWDVEQIDQDVVTIHLEVGEDAKETSAIPLRAHQLGIYGVENTLRHVAAIGTGLITKPQ